MTTTVTTLEADSAGHALAELVELLEADSAGHALAELVELLEADPGTTALLVSRRKGPLCGLERHPALGRPSIERVHHHSSRADLTNGARLYVRHVTGIDAARRLGGLELVAVALPDELPADATEFLEWRLRRAQPGPLTVIRIR